MAGLISPPEREGGRERDGKISMKFVVFARYELGTSHYESHPAFRIIFVGDRKPARNQVPQYRLATGARKRDN